MENEKTVYYAEYNSGGAGVSTKSRVPWSKQLSNEEAKKYTAEIIFSSTCVGVNQDKSWFQFLETKPFYWPEVKK